MDVVFLDTVQNPDWIEYISHQSQACVFHHPAWAELIASTYGFRPFVFAVVDSGKIVSGLPFLETNSYLKGRRWVSLPFTDYMLPLEERTNPFLTEKLAELVDDGRIPDVEIRWKLPESALSHPQIDSVLHLLHLHADLEKTKKSIHPMHKRNLRQAEKNGIRVEMHKDLKSVEKFYGLHVHTRQRQGVPVQPWKFFINLYERVISQGLGYILLAYEKEACIAGAVFLHWQKTLTYKYGASLTRALSLRPNNLIFWKAIEWGCQNGYAVFDMGKTDADQSGLREFKSRWGADEMPLVYTSISHTLPKASVTSGRLMKGVQTLIKNTPPIVCRILGECFYKQVG